MSLFDDDDSISSSVSSSVEDGGECHVEGGRGNVVSSTIDIGGMNSVPFLSSVVGDKDVSRFTLTSEENKRAEERRRKEIHNRSMLRGVSTAEATDDRLKEGQSRFQMSIAETLRLRKETREAVLLQRIRKQRQEEAGCGELVNKDLEVGVFVTPQYLAALKRHKQSLQGVSQAHVQNIVEGGEDAVDPLEAYVSQLEGKRAALSFNSPPVGFVSDVLPGDVFSCEQARMVMIEQAEQNNSDINNSDIVVSGGNAPTTGNAKLHPPTMMSTSSSVVSNDVLSKEPCDNSMDCCLSQPAASISVVHPEDVLREARENRKRSRADIHFIEAAAERFNQRAAKRLGIR